MVYATMNPKLTWHEVVEGNHLSMRSLADIVSHLRRGGLAVLPTETGYMVGADASARRAVEKVYGLKRRPLDLPVHVAVASLDMASRFADVNVYQRRVMEALCPGPITTICSSNGTLVPELVEWRGTVGIRIPAVASTLQVISDFGLPLTATSFNAHGEDPGTDIEEGLSRLDLLTPEVVHVVRSDGAQQFSVPSTLVRIGAAGEVELLRQGPVSREMIRRALSAPSHSEVAEWT
jgi:L-threonylcarbamoyladenylate synthase